MSESKEYAVTIEDANIAAFLVSKGFTPIPFIIREQSESESAKVAWDVMCEKEDEVRDAISKFYSNERIGVRDFVRVLKEIRSSMYQMKRTSNQLKES